MYVAVKGGQKAIEAAHRLLAKERRGDPAAPGLSVRQIKEQLTLAVDRVMAEGALHDPDLAALAIKQARGDLVEAIFLLRAFRTTLPRLYVTEPLDTGSLTLKRRISATFKDIPGGQILGPTFDYTHRLLDFSLLDVEDAREPGAVARPMDAHPTGGSGGDHSPQPPEASSTANARPPRVASLLQDEGLMAAEAPTDDEPAGDLTREPLTLPAERDLRLQNLARGDEGFLLALGYSTQRGFANNHPFAGEIRMGLAAVSITPEELGFPVEIGDIVVTECEMVNQFKGSETEPPQFTRGYGLTVGFNERKAMAMALVDRALRARDFGESVSAPAQDEEFVLLHSDNVEAQGFVQHLKLPHHVDFQAELELIRLLRAQAGHGPARDARPDAESVSDDGPEDKEARP